MQNVYVYIRGGGDPAKGYTHQSPHWSGLFGPIASTALLIFQARAGEVFQQSKFGKKFLVSSLKAQWSQPINFFTLRVRPLVFQPFRLQDETCV